MSADSMYSDDWNSCLTGSQMNAWNLEDDISRIDSRAEDFLSGIWNAESCASEKKSKWKAPSNEDSSDPFRRFQTPLSGRTSPTPLADLYSQSIYQAEVNSDAWQSPENDNCSDPVDEEECCSPNTDEEECCSPNTKDVDCMPQDLFSFSQQDAPHTEESSLETLNRSLVEEAPSASTEEAKSDYTPKLIVNTTKGDSEHPARHPLLSLSIGMSICGVGLVFGAQIMHNTAVVNPGKSLIIAGLVGLFVSVVLQSVHWLGRRKTA